MTDWDRLRTPVAARARAVRPGPDPRRAQAGARSARAGAAQLERGPVRPARLRARGRRRRAAERRVLPGARVRRLPRRRGRVARRDAVARDPGTRRAGADRLDRGRLRRSRHAGRRAGADLRAVRQVCSAVRRRDRRRAGTELSIDLEAIAAAAHATRARLVWVCDPNNPTGDADRARRAGLRSSTGCRATASWSPTRRTSTSPHPTARASASGRRARRAPGDRRCARSRRSSAWQGCDWATRWPTRASRTCSTSCRSRSTSTASRSPPVAPRSRTRSSCRRAAPRSPRRARRSPTSSRARGSEALPSQANFLLVELGVDDRPVCAALLRHGLLIRGGHEFGLPGLRARHDRPGARDAAGRP